MTQEEKAKAYDEAIEKLRSLHDEYDIVSIKEELEHIFPQLKESENERIRKSLIMTINNICNSDEGLVTFNGFSKEQILTWLEKQGEQKSADKCEGCNNAKGCVACVDGSEWAHIEEHNPAWGEEDEEMLRRCISATFDHGYLRECDWLKSLKDRVGCEVNCTTTKEWSVEDEINYNYALAACKYYGEAKGYADTETHQKANNWLKSLKKRVGNFDDGYKVGFSAAKHNQWKPSDAQMASITCAVRKMKESACYDSELVSLYQDLKKLK